jgi:hypothetical protein
LPGVLDAAAPCPGVTVEQLANFDFTRPRAAVLLAIGFILSRLPWVNLGYGADPDAWRVAMSARYLITHGSYVPSRLPGYPVHDIAMAAFIRGGWLFTNASTIVVSLVGVLLFAAIVRKMRLAGGGLLTLTFAFLPLLWPTSVATLDYSWALTFLLGAYLAVCLDRPHLAGVLLGLAGGCRVTYLAFGLPLALLVWRRARLTRAAAFGVTALATWLIVFAPVWLRYGTGFWNFYDVRPGWGDFARSLTEGSIGIAPLIVLLVALALSWRTLLTVPSLLQTDAHMSVWAMIVLLTLFVFIRLPLQTYYLMPAAPFALLLLQRVLRPVLLVVACAALVAGGFVDVYTTTVGGWRSPLAVLHIRPQAGLVVQDYQLQVQRLDLVRAIPDLDLPSHSVLAAGFYFPTVAELYHSRLTLILPDGYLTQIGPLTDSARADGDGDISYVWLLSPGDARGLLRRGYALYSLDFSRETSRPQAIPIYQPENERFGLH